MSEAGLQPARSRDDNIVARGKIDDEVVKLRKINKVLMDRVERDMDAQGGSAFSLFQTAITLESRVSERTSELTQLTQQLLCEVAERREAEIALVRATTDAQQANISKTRFVAAASHDLKQPLNAARLFVSALADEVAAGRPRELVEQLSAALDATSEMLDTLLEISKLDAGAWPVQRSNFHLAPLLDRLMEEYRPQARACGLQLRVVQCNAMLHTDRTLLERILRNFISNAIRYTEHGCVLVGCRRAVGAVRIEVWDTGIGIPAGELDEIFQEFRRLSNDLRRDKGIGLGLAIVDRIARLLELPIEVSSAVGRGSGFKVTVPGAKPPDPADLPLDLPRSALVGRMIWVIEPDPARLASTAALLGTWGCDVRSAASVLQALQLAGSPELIIADGGSPRCPLGTEAIGLLHGRVGPVPVLLLSDDRSPELRTRMRPLGCTFLPKSAGPAKLRAMISFVMMQRA